MNIKIVRLTTGEELICDAKVNSTDQVILKDVAILIPTQQNQLGLAPFMAYSDAKDGFHTTMNSIMFIVEPQAELKNQYQKMFSKIITPASNIIA
tara:strand:+ start:1340 stop:1624 length:285 start_codon:yes stop_codon:yes gene_type:complete